MTLAGRVQTSRSIPSSRVQPTTTAADDGVAEHAKVLFNFVTNVQRFAGFVAREATCDELYESFEALLDTVHKMHTHAERLIAERLLNEAFGHLRDQTSLSPTLLTIPRLWTLGEIWVHFRDLKESRARRSARKLEQFFHVLYERHARSGLRQSEVAHALEMSVSQLSRLVNGETRHRFEWHLTELRIERAARLLRETELRVKEVAAAVGFSATSELDHAFKTKLGMTPTQYRATVSLKVKAHADVDIARVADAGRLAKKT